jgi:hypothetical protein
MRAELNTKDSESCPDIIIVEDLGTKGMEATDRTPASAQEKLDPPGLSV